MPVPDVREVVLAGAGEPRATLFWILKHSLLAFPEPDCNLNLCCGDEILFLDFRMDSVGGLENLLLLPNSILVYFPLTSGVASTAACGVSGIVLNVACGLVVLDIWTWDIRDIAFFSGNMDIRSLSLGRIAIEDRLLGWRGICRIMGTKDTRRALPAALSTTALFIIGMFSLF